MTRKRKADIEEEERRFSKDITEIRNPSLRHVEFTTIASSGTHVETLTSVDRSRATKGSHTTSPQASVSKESKTSKSVTQVGVKHADRRALLTLITEFATSRGF